MRGSIVAHLISSDATFMSELNRNVDERHPIHIFVAIEDVVTGDVSPPICNLPGSSRCTIEEIPDVAQEEGNSCVELVPYQRGDPISFCCPNVEPVNVGDEEE